MVSVSIRALSTDTLPTNVPSGTISELTDVYFYTWFDGTDWLPVYESVPLSGSHGYTFGGNVSENVIQEQEHGTTTTGTDKANLVANNQRGCNAQTSSIIVCMGGNTGGGLIQQYSIGTTTNAVDKADSVSDYNQSWTHCYSTTHAYTMGGWIGSSTTDIEEYEFNTTVNAVDKSSLSIGIAANAGGTNGTYSYSYCGVDPSINSNRIEQYELGTGTTSSDVADATGVKRVNVTTQNTTLLISNGGYVSGDIDVIEEFTMATTTNASDKANLLLDNSAMSGTQSPTHGYTAGGGGSGVGAVINQYEFGTTVNAVQKGNLIAGNQNSFSGGSGTP